MPKNNGYGQAEIISASDWQKLKRQLSDNWFRPFVYIAYLTGERWGAICQLRREDIFEPWSGRPRAYITFRRETRKGKDETRQVPIHPDLFPVLKEWELPAGEFLFPARFGGSIKLRTADAAFRRLLEKCGMENRGFSCHSTRRTFVTNLYRAGVDIRTIQQLTGHKSISMVARYIEADPNRIKAALSMLMA